MTAVPHPLYFSLYPRLKINPTGRHFDTNEVFKAESQTVLNTLTKHDFLHAFQKWQKHWERCMCVKGDYFKDDDGHRPKITF
jgi:hypothetical protein